MSPALLHGALYLAFFASGVSALIYQVVWSRYLTLFVGGTSFAHTIVLATFMGGLACGNWLFGRLADRARIDKLLLYALLEVGIGLLCLLFPTSFSVLSELYVRVGSRAGLQSPLNPFLKVGLSAASMFLPCVLMGGTLPVLAKFIVDSLASFGVRLSWLYFINTAGAVGGCLLGGLYVVEHWGLEFGMVGVSLVNLLVGGVAYLIYRQVRLRRLEDGPPSRAGQPLLEAPGAEDELERYSEAQARAAFWCIAVGGGLSMLYELVWVRLLVLSIGGTVHAFSMMLVGFIAGIALGAWIAGRLLRRRRNALALFGVCELGISVCVLVPLSAYQALPFFFFRIASSIPHTPGTYPIHLLIAVGVAALLMLVPATLMGATLPLATRVCVDRLSSLGRGVGDVFSANTLGNVAGAALTGFVLLPSLGLERTLVLGGVLSGLLAVILLRFWRPLGTGRPWTGIVHAVGATPPVSGPRLWPLVLGLVLLGAGWRVWPLSSWDARLMQFGLYQWEKRYDFPSWQAFVSARTRARLLYQGDGSDVCVTVEEVEIPLNVAPWTLKARALRINGKPDASTLGDLPTQLLLGHIGMFLHPDPRRVMVVGLGSGATAGAILRHPGTTVDLAEISPEVVKAAGSFDAVNDGVLRNPRLSLYLLDAREFLLLGRGQYDLIVSEPTNAWIPGVANLFTRDFYRVVLDRLRPGGVFVQWLPLYSTGERVVAGTICTLRSTFDYVSAWGVAGMDLILVAGRERPRFDPELFARRLSTVRPGDGHPAAAAFLSDPPVFLALQVATDEALRLRWPRGDAPVLRDLFPRLEFAAARAQFLGTGYAMENDLDERLERIASEPLFLAQYLSRYPLRADERRRLIDVLGRSPSPIHVRLARRLAVSSVLEGDEDAGTILPLADKGVATALLARALGREVDEEGQRPGAARCDNYLRAMGEALAAGSSVLGRPSTKSLEERVDACVARHPEAADALRLGLVRALANAGAVAPALERVRVLEADGGLERVAAWERARLAVTGSRLEVQAGNRERARQWAERAIRWDPSNAEAADLLKVLAPFPP